MNSSGTIQGYLAECSANRSKQVIFSSSLQDAAVGVQELLKASTVRVRIVTPSLHEDIFCSDAFVKGLQNLLLKKVMLQVCLQKEKVGKAFGSRAFGIFHYFCALYPDLIQVKATPAQVIKEGDSQVSLVLGDRNMYFSCESAKESLITKGYTFDYNDVREYRNYERLFGKLFNHAKAEKVALWRN